MRGRAAVSVAIAAALLAACAVPAVASKGVTQSATTTLPELNILKGTASCTGRTHLTSGGFTMLPASPGGSSLANFTTWSQANGPTGAKGWSATSAAFADGAGTTTYNLTTAARCEKVADGVIAVRLSGQLPLSQSTGGSLIGHCPSGTHALSGGYSVNNHTDPNDFPNTSKLIVLGNRRTNATTWVISAYVLSNAAYPPSTLTGTVLCERNSRRKVTVHKSTTVYTDDGRTVGLAFCGKREHVVSGGFVFNPAVFPGSVPAPFMDRDAPAGGKSWRVEAYDLGQFGSPPGASLDTFAYCRRNRPKRHRAHSRAATSAAPGSGHGWVEATPAEPVDVG